MSDKGSDEESEEDGGQPFGEDDYEMKKAAIQYNKYNTFNVLLFKEAYSETKKGFLNELSTTTEVLKETITPSFMKRLQHKKRFPAKIAASEM